MTAGAILSLYHALWQEIYTLDWWVIELVALPFFEDYSRGHFPKGYLSPWHCCHPTCSTECWHICLRDHHIFLPLIMYGTVLNKKLVSSTTSEDCCWLDSACAAGIDYQPTKWHTATVQLNAQVFECLYSKSWWLQW